MDLTASIQHITFPCSFSHFSGNFWNLSSSVKPRATDSIGNGATYTEEAVELLTVPIEKRTAWEHQKMLFNTHIEDFSLSSQYCMKQGTESLGWSHQQNLEHNNKQKQKQHCVHQLKTPDLVPIAHQNCLGFFSLEKQKVGAAIYAKKVYCNCKKSKCLKMYCQCFRNGETCEGCQCCECGNEDQRGEDRKKARRMVQQKQPVAFVEVFKYKGCRCSRSNCQKGYCQCFVNGLMCGKYCKCRQCENCSAYMKKKQEKVGQKHKVSSRM